MSVVINSSVAGGGGTTVSGISDVPGLEAALDGKLGADQAIVPSALPDAGAGTDDTFWQRDVAGTMTVFKQSRADLLSTVSANIAALQASAEAEFVMTAASLKLFARRVWRTWRQAEGFGTVFVPNTATVFYVDVTRGTNGAGTLADPMNAVPAVVTNGATYLLKEGTTWVLTSNRFGTGIGSSTLFGTYEAGTGRRLLTEISRLATIQWTGFTGIFNPGPTNTSVTWSGLRFYCPDVQMGDRRAIWTTSTATAISPTFEYLYCDKLDSRLPGNTAVPPGSVIFSFSADTTVRFCTFRGVIADAIWTQGPRFAWYGNDIVLDPSDVNGPDGMQHTNGGVPMEFARVVANWSEVPTNQKQCLISSGTGYATSDSAYIARNVFWGCDISLPKLGADNQKVCEWGGYNPLFESNIFVGGQFGLNLSQVGNVRGNIFASFSGVPSDVALTANDLYQGLVLPGAGTARATNNTFLRLAGTGGTAIAAYAGTHIVSDNIVRGAFQNGIRSNATASEHDNIIHGPVIPFVDNLYAVKAPGTGSLNADPLLDAIARPRPGSPAIGKKSADSRHYTDLQGYPMVVAAGAMQELAEG